MANVSMLMNKGRIIYSPNSGSGSTPISTKDGNIIKNDEGLYASITDESLTEIKFGIDENGNYGYYKAGADTITPFKTGDGSGGSFKKGTFTSSSESQGIVNVDIGFKPELLFVILPFDNGNTYSYYESEMNNNSLWTIPQEGVIYTIIFNSESGETGIYNITNTGFSFRSNAANTCGVECTYYACRDTGGGKTSSSLATNIKNVKIVNFETDSRFSNFNDNGLPWSYYQSTHYSFRDDSIIPYTSNITTSHSQDSEETITFTTDKPIYFIVYYNSYTEDGYDKGRLLVDEEVYIDWFSGNPVDPWYRAFIKVPAGEHILKFIYHRDSNGGPDDGGVSFIFLEEGDEI